MHSYLQYICTKHMLMYCIVSCDIVLRRKCIEQFLLIWAQIRSTTLLHFLISLHFFYFPFSYICLCQPAKKQSIIVQTPPNLGVELVMDQVSKIRFLDTHNQPKNGFNATFLHFFASFGGI